MRKIKTVITLSCVSLLVACGGPATDATVPEAEPAGATSVDIGEHIVHFSAQSTDNLPPEVARAYDFVRSKNRAMLTVSVLEKDTNKAVPAEVTEGDAIYYVGETSVANHETLIFDITITPEGVNKSVDVRFKRQFFTN